MSSQTSRWRLPLVPVLVGVAALAVMCAGAAATVVYQPWQLLAPPEARVIGCVVDEHAVPFPTEAGLAEVTVDVANLSGQDRIYLVGVVVKSRGGQVVGSVEHRIGVPASTHRRQTWRVVLTRQGGRDCEISKVESA